MPWLLWQANDVWWRFEYLLIYGLPVICCTLYQLEAILFYLMPRMKNEYAMKILSDLANFIGGRLSATKKKTNKVSTFDADSQTWTSYYPDLLSVRVDLG